MAVLGKRLMSAAGTAGVLAATMLYVAAPASAAEYSYDVITYKYGDYPAAAGQEIFVTEGDNFQICDNSSDGAGVIGYWKLSSTGAVNSHYNGGGRNTCSTSNQDFAESATVYIKVCLRDDGVVVSNTCSEWYKGYADGVP
ncbi:hypothetical protein OG381_22805 [Streptomyces sp. NBC_00490]|uniref:hypothetical protein n=1 Tax=Streptomyces sp. NBC_00490 TaxID=2903657 RepID=UPI002E199403